MALVARGLWPREEAVAYFRSLFAGGLERDSFDDHVWSVLVRVCREIHPAELLDEIRQAYEDDQVDEFFVGGVERAERDAACDLDEVLAALQTEERYFWITEAIEDIEWWAAFEPEASEVRQPESRGGTSGHGVSKATKAKAKQKRKMAKTSRRKNR